MPSAQRCVTGFISRAHIPLSVSLQQLPRFSPIPTLQSHPRSLYPMSSWQHELERLAQPADLTGHELESSRIRGQQMQQQQLQKQQPGRGGDRQQNSFLAASYSTAPIHSERHHDHEPDSHLTCESCTAQSASSFCSACDQLLCSSCDARVHATATAAAQSHARAPAAQVIAFRIPCPEAHHSAQRLPSSQMLLRFYCRTCSRPVCSACRSAPGGAHPDSGPAHARHDVVRLEDAWAAQMRVLCATVGSASAMHDKKQQILAELRSMDRALAQLSSALLQVESAESARTSQILSRLRNISELNGVKINQAVARVQGDIAAIDEFLRTTAVVPVPASTLDSDTATAAGAGVKSAAAATASAASAASATSSSLAIAPATPAIMCRFLRSCHLWPADAAQLALLPSASAAEAPALTALPREAHDRSHALSQFPRLLALLRVKDELLRFAMASRKGLLAEQAQHLATLQTLYDESQREMEAWMTLSERLSREMQAIKQKCCFCGVALSGAAASTPCAQNQPQQSQQQPQPHFEGLDRREGDGLHYFVNA